uniref:hypothetical protein n=1 Tax=Stenotrophomonas maltophilia TaxID=40324 RepID=UPI000B1D7B91
RFRSKRSAPSVFPLWGWQANRAAPHDLGRETGGNDWQKCHSGTFGDRHCIGQIMRIRMISVLSKCRDVATFHAIQWALRKRPTSAVLPWWTAPRNVWRRSKSDSESLLAVWQAVWHSPGWASVAMRVGCIQSALVAATVADKIIAEQYASTVESKAYVGAPYADDSGNPATVATIKDWCHLMTRLEKRHDVAFGCLAGGVV